MIHFNRKIKRDILNYIKVHNGSFYGDMVESLDYPAYKVMRTLIELKQQGKVFKDTNGGKFKIA